MNATFNVSDFVVFSPDSLDYITVDNCLLYTESVRHQQTAIMIFSIVLILLVIRLYTKK